MIHDLYLRAHITCGERDRGEGTQSRKWKRPANLWPAYALVWDTETALDLEQTLNFGVWRFCELQGSEYVSVQEGILYRDRLAAKDIQTILAYKRKHLADHLAAGADTELLVLSRADFVEKVFWDRSVLGHWSSALTCPLTSHVFARAGPLHAMAASLWCSAS
jgi:hypothetical protein